MSDYDDLKELFAAKAIQLVDNSGREQILQGIVNALVHIVDPHLNTDILTLELVRGISINEKGSVELTMTLTSAGCPYAQEILTGVQSGILNVQGVHDVDIQLVWLPPWEPSEDLRNTLGLWDWMPG